jgi:hypothetical protein
MPRDSALPQERGVLSVFVFRPVVHDGAQHVTTHSFTARLLMLCF